MFEFTKEIWMTKKLATLIAHDKQILTNCAGQLCWLRVISFGYDTVAY